MLGSVTHLAFTLVLTAAAEPLVATDRILPPMSVRRSPAILPDNQLLRYEGRWTKESKVASADWPCSTLKFGINATTPGDIKVFWAARLTRLSFTVLAVDPKQVLINDVVDSTSSIDNGLEFDSEQMENDEHVLPSIARVGVLHGTMRSTIKIDRPGSFVVAVRKLTQAAPYGPGIGKVLGSSTLQFKGVDLSSGLEITPPPTKARRITFIGASDTAGWCVDGSPSTPKLDYTLKGFMFTNCDGSYAAELGRRFEADISVQAFAGAGVTQNANAAQQWQLGPRPMPELYNRTRQMVKGSYWNEPPPQNLVFVSLGGNDYNHQNGNVPSNITFMRGYASLLDRLFSGEGLGNGTYDAKIISICGMGSPEESKYDPDNTRCKPCPHVQQAVESYRDMHPDRRVDFILVPCDGSVVNGTAAGDIGCAGHKNLQGQQKVADFLTPKVASIMGWNMVA